MTVTVFGATGVIGRLVVDNLLTKGCHVRAYVRSAPKVPIEWGSRVNVVVGELDDAAAVERAVVGSSAVISALGPSLDRKATGMPLVQGTQNIVDAMQRNGVRRIIGHATPSVVDRRDRRTLQARLVALLGRSMFPRAYRELLAMSEIITNSGLEWTIVRFIGPRNGDAKGIGGEGFFGSDKIGWAATRADIARFTADQLDDQKYVHAAPAISN